MSVPVLIALLKMDIKDEKQLAPIKQTRSLDQGITPAELKKAVREEEGRRKIIKDYIQRNMKKGVDYDTVVGNKPTLLKPGSEKFCSLMHLTPKFRRDDDSWEMSGKKPGRYFYLCELFNDTGKLVGEGRGAANIEEKRNWTDNNCIKIAEKRAQMDAVLRTAGLSDFFTQDMEDQKIQQRNEINFARSGSPAVLQDTRKPYVVPRPSRETLDAIVREAARKGVKPEEAASILKDKFKVTHLKELNRVQASLFLGELVKRPELTSPAATMSKPDDDLDIGEVSRAIG